jgi:uncharacterized protein
MALLEKQLYVKKSLIPGSGKGLFTKKFIPKGTRIVEYKGEILTWKEVEKMADERNGYVFFVNSRHVIDAWDYKDTFGRYANDAKGIGRAENAKTNSEYITYKKRCYIKSLKDIPAKSEIFVEYGAEYWQVIRYNYRLEQKNKEKELKKRKLAKRQKAAK